MKVLEFRLKNIKAIEFLHWQLPVGQSAAGWHVILGDNGSGKSTFLKALAIGILGKDRATSLGIDYADWLRQHTLEGNISVSLQSEVGDELAPQRESADLMVLGIGEGGANAVKYMRRQGIKDVELAICSTNRLALAGSTALSKLQIGLNATKGMGSGGHPERGRQAAQESRKQIQEFLDKGTKILFIVAAMGGGTGTGAAPLIAGIARELGIVTMAIVTMPFLFEGQKKRRQAEEGIKELKEHCDTVLVIFNDKLPKIYGNLTMSAAFAKADAVMSIATRAITGIITVKSDVNVDFEDVKFVLKGGGGAVIGSSVMAGENRAQRAVEEALNSPLLDDTDIRGAERILLSILSGPEHELEMDELTEITEFIQESAGTHAEMIFGHGIDETLGASIRVTIIAAGFPKTELSGENNSLGDFTTFVQVGHTNSLPLVENLPTVLSPPQDSKTYHLQLVLSSAATGKASPLSVMAMEDGQEAFYQTSWANNKGWFSAGFGPFRRFTGGDAESHKLFTGEQHKRLAAHLSLFKENVALVEALNWLKQLKFRSLESHASTFLNLLIAFINQPDFLPNGTRLVEVSSKGVFFEDAHNARISLDELSDGFRSVLSLAFELLRQLESQYEEAVFESFPVPGQPDLIRVQIPGIVLIDEIDAHLHPIWQKRVGYWLTKHFPLMQFFVTTHSPLVCQAAEYGSVYQLPRPGANEDGGMVAGTELKRLIYGNVLEAYSTEVFGLISTQSESGQQKTHQLTALNEKALNHPLSADEKQARDELRAALPISDSEDFIKKLLSDL